MIIRYFNRFRTQKANCGCILLGSFAQKILVDISLYLSSQRCNKWSDASLYASTRKLLKQAVRMCFPSAPLPCAAPPSTQWIFAPNTVSNLPLHIHRKRIIVFLGTSPAPSNPHQSLPTFGVSTGNPWI